MNKTLIITGISLVLVGVIFVAATVYQEQVSPPTTAPHMQPQAPAEYEWRSRNGALTISGVMMVAIGLFFIYMGIKWKSQK